MLTNKVICVLVTVTDPGTTVAVKPPVSVTLTVAPGWKSVPAIVTDTLFVFRVPAGPALVIGRYREDAEERPGAAGRRVAIAVRHGHVAGADRGVRPRR